MKYARNIGVCHDVKDMWNVIGKNIALRNCLNPNTY
jgi:hypothetical protein